MTDLALIGSLVLVTGWFGGRTPQGQLILSGCALTAALAWSVHQLTTSQRTWSRIPGVLVWFAAAVVLGLQLSDISASWQRFLSPELQATLPLWFQEGIPGIPEGGWHSVSLSPGATMLGIPLFISYGLLFFTAIQRFRAVEDLEQFLARYSVVVVCWAGFALIQYWFHNGKFYWLIQPPAPFDGSSANGPFTNRNHFAQFLSLGIGPLLWCVMSRFTDSSQTSDLQKPRDARGAAGLWCWIACTLLVLIVTVLTFSRGGFLAAGVAAGVAAILLVRERGLQNSWFLGLLAVIVLATGAMGIDRTFARFSQVDEENVRFSIWKANWEVASEFPWLGTGIGTHLNAHQLKLTEAVQGKEFTHAESSVLQVASETGFVGLAVAIVAMLLAIRCPLLVTLCASSRRLKLLSAAILGSLCANFFHACVDFVWHVPACMVPLLMLTAGGCRLRAWHREQFGVGASRDASWIGWSVAGTAVATAGLCATMLAGQIASSEAAVRDYQLLSWQPPSDFASMTEEELDYYFHEKAKAAFQAAKLRPYDSRAQVWAARSCLKVFERRMRSSDSPLTILEIKDAVRSSDFESSAKIREWVQTVTGEHWKLLLTARKLAERSLKASPLEGDAYLVLAELAFLTDASGKLESKYIDQTLQIRPFEVQTRYAAGQRALFAGDLKQVMHHWGFCYVRNPGDRLAIARIIVHMAESKSLLDQLQISWQDAGPLIVAYQEANQTEDARFLMKWVAEGAETAAEATPQMAHLWTIAFSRRVELGETDRAIDLLKRAINWHPALRKNLGLLLLEAGHSNEAIEHLKWAAMRSPDDAVVQTALKNAFDRGLMSEDALAHEWEAQFE